MGKKLFSLTGLLVALGLFIAVNAFAKVALRRSHIDLTERNLYSLSEGTRNILEALEEPQDLRFYFTPEEAPDGSPIPAYAQRVRELLEEYVSAANGKLRLTVIDPKPFTEEEDQAAQAGLRGIPINEVGDKLYFGLVATNSVDARETIPFFDPSREEALEYDLTQIVYRLGTPDRPVVGVLSSIPLEGGGAPDPRTGRQAQAWTVSTLLSQALDVRQVESQTDRIDPAIDVLMLVHPKDLSDTTLYAIDQFVMAGGHIMAFVDPYCFFDPGAQADPRTGMGGDHSSHLDRLLKSWGVELDTSKIAGDRIKAQQIDSANGPIFCPVVLAMDEECLDQDDVAIRELSSLNMLLAGSFTALEGATTTMTPLVQTSEEGSGSLDAMQLQFGQPDFVRLTEAFVPDQKRRAVAVRVTGKIQSAFQDGPPTRPEGAEEPATELPAHLSESKEALQAVLVADVDILADPLWTSDRGFFRQITAGNGSLAVNVLENLCGSSDLISLRSREGFQRPFTKKAELEQAAGERLKAKQKEIEAALRETEAKLAKLQGPQDAPGGALLSSEQEAELERANRTYMDQRKELREVRSQLNADIKSLGTRLKLFNTLAIPLVLLIVALFSARNQVRARRTQ